MEYDTASRYYGALIARYLRAGPAGALDEAIARFVAPVRSAFVHDRASESVIDGMLWAAWEPVLLAAGTASAATQDRLVDLLAGIKSQGVLTRDRGQQECVIWGGLKVFTDLPCFGAQMREAWDMRADPRGSPDVWANMNAFAARLTAAGFDFSLYAIWTFRDCLEEGDLPGRADLRAVVPWFRHCGPRRSLRSWNLWPAVLPEFEIAWMAYYHAMSDVGGRLMCLFARGLRLPPGFFIDKIDKGLNLLRAVNYPAQDSDSKPGQLRAAAHTDGGLVTILRQDALGGLEVLDSGGSWIGVKPVPGAFVIILGDLMARWTNGEWRSSPHRVVDPPDPSSAAARRQSIPFSQNANWSARDFCLPPA